MCSLAKFRPEEKEGHLWVCNAIEHFVRHFGCDFRKPSLTDKYGNETPIESPEVSYWVRDDDHLEQGYMEMQRPYYMQYLSDILRFFPVNFPVLVQIWMP